MVKRYTFTYQLPSPVEFNHPPLLLAIKLFYVQLKKLTCMNSNPVCHQCPLTHKCIYHYLSGENFNEFPSIIIDRELLEPLVYQASDSFVIKITMLDDTFENYVIRFFEELRQLEETHLILKHKEIDIIDVNEYFDGRLIIKAPIELKSIERQIKYYQTKYLIKFEAPRSAIWKYHKTIKYHQVVRINGKWIHIHGEIGELNVEHVNKLLLYTGVGTYSFLLGGQMDEIKD